MLTMEKKKRKNW